MLLLDLYVLFNLDKMISPSIVNHPASHLCSYYFLILLSFSIFLHSLFPRRGLIEDIARVCLRQLLNLFRAKFPQLIIYA